MTIRWIWIVVCVAALASAAPPPPPPPNPEIVYLEAGTREKIMVMNSDGSNKTVVYSGAAGQILSKPRFSPDARWIAFTAAGVGLYRLERATGVATVLLTNANCGQSCWSPRFSPWGTRIAVIDLNQNDPKVLTVPPTGGTPQVLYGGPAGVLFRDVAWSTDETRIAVIEFGGGLPNRIRLVDLRTQPPTPRTILQASADTTIDVLDWARNNVDSARSLPGLIARNDGGIFVGAEARLRVHGLVYADWLFEVARGAQVDIVGSVLGDDRTLSFWNAGASVVIRYDPAVLGTPGLSVPTNSPAVAWVADWQELP